MDGNSIQKQKQNAPCWHSYTISVHICSDVLWWLTSFHTASLTQEKKREKKVISCLHPKHTSTDERKRLSRNELRSCSDVIANTPVFWEQPLCVCVRSKSYSPLGPRSNEMSKHVGLSLLKRGLISVNIGLASVLWWSRPFCTDVMALVPESRQRKIKCKEKKNARVFTSLLFLLC